jgi:hypothetical protein
VFLHIGAPKTGTTFLQTVLNKNRKALRQAGVLFPGRSERSHFLAAQDLREMSFHGHPEAGAAGAWPRLVREVRGFAGTSVIDHEIFAAASEPAIDRALADLDFADVHLVWTARDLARQLPAAWQERVKNGDPITFGTFLQRVRAGAEDDTAHRRGFWALHGGPEILRRWSRTLPPDRVHVVTVPPPGADPMLLWRRFAQVIGVDPGGYDTDVPAANASLSAAEVATLRRLNELLGSEIPWPAYRAVVKHGLIRAMRAPGEPRGAAIDVPDDVYAWALRWSQDAVAALRAAGYAVVGDLDELLPARRPTGADPDRMPAGEDAEAAIRMLAALVRVFADDPRWRIGEGLSRLTRGRLPVVVLYRSGDRALPQRLVDAARPSAEPSGAAPVGERSQRW